MKRLRELKKWGNAHVVIFTKMDVKDMGLKEGDEVDISQVKIKKSRSSASQKKK